MSPPHFFLSFSLFPPPSNTPRSSSSLKWERSSYHQSVFSSCGLRQCHAGLCVLPDRTTVPSGYPYTSSLTPMIFTCSEENWKVHRSLKGCMTESKFGLLELPCFLSGLGMKVEWKFLSISNRSPLQRALLMRTQWENVLARSVMWSTERPSQCITSAKQRWSKIGF